MGARLRLPPSSFPGPWAPRPAPSHHAVVSRLARGTYGSFLHPAWPGRVPLARSLSRFCHFSSASLFLLSASYTPWRLHGKAWLPPRPRLKPVARAQVSGGSPACPVGSPRLAPEPAVGTRQTAGLLGGDPGPRCSGGKTGDSEPAPTPTSSCHIWSLRQPCQVAPSRLMPCTVRILRLFPFG